MTKPETEWMLVPREPTEAMTIAGVVANQERMVADVYKAMLSASPPAPSVPDVVREWQTHDRGSWTYERLHGFADCMAAALTAQAKTIENLRRKNKHEFIVAEDALQRSNDLALRIADLEEHNAIRLAVAESAQQRASEWEEKYRTQAAEVERLTGEVAAAHAGLRAANASIGESADLAAHFKSSLETAMRGAGKDREVVR